MAPRWRKATRDLLARPGRTALAILALVAGVFQVGAMLYKFALLQPELTTMYGRTDPAAAVFTTDVATDDVVDIVRRVPGVGHAEARPVVLARVRKGDAEWIPAVVSVVRDFDAQTIDTFKPEAGAWPPGRDEIVLERSALEFAHIAIGDTVTLRLPGGEDRAVRVAGTVYAPGLAPAWMEHVVPAWVTWDSPVRGPADGSGESAQIRMRVADHALDEGYVQEVADSAQAALERAGHVVSRVTIPPPGKHPHADQMAAFLFLLLTFGILSFALSMLLVTGMIHGLMQEQVREVGVMKALGATDPQVAGIYLGQVAILAAVALVIGTPIGLFVGRVYAEFSAGILNVDLTHRPFPIWLLFAELVLGVVLPLLVALIPIRRAARVSVHEALSDGAGAGAFGERPFERALLSIRALPRPLALSLRTALRHPARVALTVAMLAVGGAAFMAALNTAAAWNGAVENDFAHRRYDLTVVLAEFQATAELDRTLAAVPAVAHAEYWPGASPYLVGPHGVSTVTATMLGPDPGSELLRLPLVSGRWLEPGDVDAVVINQSVVKNLPGIGVGDSVGVRQRGRTTRFPIVGIVKEIAPMPAIYAPPGAVRGVTGRVPGESRSIRIVSRSHDDAGQLRAARALETAFEAAGIEVTGMHRMLDQKKGILDHLVILISILTMASLIVVIVGAIGLASTLTMSVVQRTREIGILSAIGATPRTIAGQVAFEGLLLAVLSWLAAFVLSIPLSWGLEYAAGMIFLRMPLPFSLSPSAAGTWLALVVVLALVCSFYPARRATGLSVREALGST